MKGRKRATDPTVAWRLRIPKSVADAITDLYRDKVTGEPIFGARSDLTTRLYRRFLKEVEEAREVRQSQKSNP